MKKILGVKSLLILMIVGLFTGSCNLDDGPQTVPIPESDVVEVATTKTNLSSLVAALQKTDLANTLKGGGPFTVLAPTNSAFSSFLSSKGFVNMDAVPTETLKQIVLNHMVTGRIDAANLNILQKNYLETLADGPVSDTNLALYFDASNGVIFNGSSKVVEADILASNGIIHIVDAVIDLPTIETFTSADDNFKELDTAFDLISPVSTLPQTIKEADSGPFTLFAPTEHAFEVLLASNTDWEFLSDINENLLTSILEHHVLNENISSNQLVSEAIFTTLEGDDITLNSLDGNIEITDGSGNSGIIIAKEITGIQAINGIIHILPTQVMIPDTMN